MPLAHQGGTEAFEQQPLRGPHRGYGTFSRNVVRRQAFVHVVLPQVKVGMLAIGIFSFLRGWEEYVFVRTLLFDKQNWVMSLYLFYVAEDVMGVDYGVVTAVGVLYVLPSVVLYTFTQKYLTQMTIGGIKG